MVIRKLTAQIILALTVLLFAAQAQAQISYTPSLLVVDVQRVLADSKAAVSLKEQLGEATEKLLASYATREDKIRQDQKTLLEARGSISEEEFNKRRADIEADIVQLRDDRNNDRRSIDSAADKGRDMIAKEVEKIATEIAASKGANMVIQRVSVIVMAPDFDITTELIEKLDKALPELKLTEKKAGS